MNRFLKIFLIERTDIIDYDEYDSFVVIASNRLKAIETTLPTWGEWKVDTTKLKVTNLGIARSQIKSGIVLGSFNAG
jgi:hypothetical protein